MSRKLKEYTQPCVPLRLYRGVKKDGTIITGQLLWAVPRETTNSALSHKLQAWIITTTPRFKGGWLVFGSKHWVHNDSLQEITDEVNSSSNT